MKILNRDSNRDIEKWMECPHKKIVINKGLDRCELTEEGLKRYAAIKGISVDLLITQLNIKVWENIYYVHHSEIQCDPDFITLVENNLKEVVFRKEDYWPVIRDLSNYKSTDKFIVVHELDLCHGVLMPSYKESLYEYNSYMDIKAKEVILEKELSKLNYSLSRLKYSLKEVR